MRYKKPLIIGLATLASLVFAAFLVLWTLDFNRFKPRVIRAVKEASGLELALHGNIEVRVGLGLRLLIHDVEVGNADWGSRPHMIRMKRCEASLAMAPLIRGVLGIDQLVFIEPDLLLETDGSGMLNILSFAKHRLGSRPQREATAQRGPFPSVREVILEKGRFTYISGRTGNTYSKRVDRLTLAARSMRSPIKINLKGFLNDRPVELAGNLGTPAEMMNGQQPWPVDLAAKIDGAVATVEGTIGDVIRLADLSLKMQAKGSSVSKILVPAGARPFSDPGPFALAASLINPGGIPALKDLDLRIGEQGPVKIRVRGSIDNLRSMHGIRLDVTASLKDLSHFSRDPARPLPSTGPFTARGSIHDTAPKTLSVHDLQISSGKDVLIGSLEMDRSGVKPRTTLKLSSPGLELQNIMVSRPRDSALMRLLQTIGPTDLTLAVGDPFGRPAVEELDLRLGKPEQTAIRIRGRINDVRAKQGVDLHVNAQGKNAADLEEILGKPVPVTGPYAISGRVEDLSGKGLVCHDFSLALGKNEVSGLLELDLAGEKPRLNAVLFSQGLDLESAVPLEQKTRQRIRVLDEMGPISLAISIADLGSRPAVPNVNLQMGTRELAEVSIKGAIQDVLSRRGVDLELAVEGKEFGRLHEIFRKSMPLQGSFSLRGRVLDSGPGVYRLEDLEANLGKNALRGWVEARAGDLARIEAQFASPDFDPDVVRSIDGKRADMLRLIGPWSFKTRVALGGERPLVESFHIAMGTPGFAEAKLTGAIRDLFAWQGVEAAFSLEGHDLSVLEKVTEKAFPFSGPFTLAGQIIDPKAGVYKVRDFKAVFGDNDLEGAFEVTLAAGRPRVSGDLSSRTLDLRPLFPKSGKGAQDGVEPKKRKNSNTRVFRRDPLPLDRLRVIDADVKLKARQILLPRLAFEGATLHIKIQNGGLELFPLRGEVGGGSAEGRFSLTTGGATAGASLELKASQVDLGAMLDTLGVQKTIEGMLRAEIEARAEGDSIGALMAGLNGRALFVVADGRIYNKYIDLLGWGLLREVYRLMNPFSRKEEFSKLNCHVNVFDVKEGLAVSRIWVTDTEHTTVKGAGEIDLEKESLAMAFRTSPKKGIGISGLAEFDLKLADFAGSFKVGGTFAQPSVAIDPTGATATIGKMLGGLALFGPLGLAAGLLDLKLGQDHPCLKAMEALENGPDTRQDSNPRMGGKKSSPPSSVSPEQEQGP